jgi:hypothetical protein
VAWRAGGSRQASPVRVHWSPQLTLSAAWFVVWCACVVAPCPCCYPPHFPRGRDDPVPASGALGSVPVHIHARGECPAALIRASDRFIHQCAWMRTGRLPRPPAALLGGGGRVWRACSVRAGCRVWWGCAGAEPALPRSPTAAAVPPCPHAPSSLQAGQKLSDAAYSGNLETLGALIASGLNVNACDQVCAPIERRGGGALNALPTPSPLLLPVLSLTHPRPPSLGWSPRMLQDGFSALHRSCVTGNIEVIKFLVAHNADVNAEDSYGDSPMHYACFCGHLDAVEVLVKAGANPNKVRGAGVYGWGVGGRVGGVASVATFPHHLTSSGGLLCARECAGVCVPAPWGAWAARTVALPLSQPASCIGAVLWAVRAGCFLGAWSGKWGCGHGGQHAETANGGSGAGPGAAVVRGHHWFHSCMGALCVRVCGGRADEP